MVTAASGVGITLEAMKHRLAALVNIGTLALVTLVLCTSIVWLSFLAANEPGGSVGEATEGAGFLLIFSFVPFSLTLITTVLYRVLDVEPDRTSITLKLD